MHATNTASDKHRNACLCGSYHSPRDCGPTNQALEMETEVGQLLMSIDKMYTSVTW